MMEPKRYYFGKFKDDEKEETMSFRISKETKELFKTHAENRYGGTSNALKEIFLEYMSQYAFKRQNINFFVKIWVPRCESEEDFHDYKGGLPQIDPNYGYDPYLDLDDLNDVVVNPNSIEDVRTWDLEDELTKDRYEEYSRWLEEYLIYYLDDGFVITIPLNNQLDYYNGGIYSMVGFENSFLHHRGISIVEFEGVVYYISFSFEINPNDTLYGIKLFYPRLLTNREAFDYAMDCGNTDLAVLIDTFNDDTSNIEHDKQLLLEKKEKLLHQLDEIDEKLSKF